jgi:hypothetical protein
MKADQDISTCGVIECPPEHSGADLAQVGRAAAPGDMGAKSNFRAAPAGGAVLREAPIRAHGSGRGFCGEV